MTSFSESELYFEYNGGIFVARWLPVPEISRLGFVSKKWMWLKIFDKVKFWVKILLRIRRCYIPQQPTSGSGDREAIQKERGRKFSMKLVSEIEF
jgi:hypothetical protein